MSTHFLERHFAKIGARAKVHGVVPSGGDAAIDIGRDEAGEFFDLGLARRSSTDVGVIDAQPRLRHLLLTTGKSKFLCGHDERHWFVAAVPETAAVSTVQTAFAALKPPAVRLLEDRLRVKPHRRNRRRNEVFTRQGEWFFVAVPKWFRVDERLVIRREPLRRGMGKPHVCEELVRQGGELVYTSNGFPEALAESQYLRLLRQRPQLRSLHWVAQKRNPQVFVRGRVRHADHKTILLNGWHQVFMNTETQSLAMRHVAFID